MLGALSFSLIFIFVHFMLGCLCRTITRLTIPKLTFSIEEFPVYLKLFQCWMLYLTYIFDLTLLSVKPTTVFLFIGYKNLFFFYIPTEDLTFVKIQLDIAVQFEYPGNAIHCLNIKDFLNTLKQIVS